MSDARCACPVRDRYDCIRLRYPRYASDWEDDSPEAEPCECACHDELGADDFEDQF